MTTHRQTDRQIDLFPHCLYSTECTFHQFLKKILKPSPPTRILSPPTSTPPLFTPSQVSPAHPHSVVAGFLSPSQPPGVRTISGVIGMGAKISNSATSIFGPSSPLSRSPGSPSSPSFSQIVMGSPSKYSPAVMAAWREGGGRREGGWVGKRERVGGKVEGKEREGGREGGRGREGEGERERFEQFSTHTQGYTSGNKFNISQTGQVLQNSYGPPSQGNYSASQGTPVLSQGSEHNRPPIKGRPNYRIAPSDGNMGEKTGKTRITGNHNEAMVVHSQPNATSTGFSIPDSTLVPLELKLVSSQNGAESKTQNGLKMDIQSQGESVNRTKCQEGLCT